jgi:hypothetical protein
MASTPNELIAGFPHSSLPKVTGEPTFEDLKVIQRLLNTNAMLVSSYVGGGRQGHLGIILMNEEYFAIAANVFPLPDNQGASPEVVAGMTAAVIAELTRLHREATQVYRTYHNVDQEIRKSGNCSSKPSTTHILMCFRTKWSVTQIARHLTYLLTF